MKLRKNIYKNMKELRNDRYDYTISKKMNESFEAVEQLQQSKKTNGNIGNMALNKQIKKKPRSDSAEDEYKLQTAEIQRTHSAEVNPYKQKVALSDKRFKRELKRKNPYGLSPDNVAKKDKYMSSEEFQKQISCMTNVISKMD